MPASRFALAESKLGRYIMRKFLVPLLVLLASAMPLLAGGARNPAGSSDSPGVMQIYQTKYYVIHSDLDTDDVKEAVIRMTRMAEEYHRRTQGFSGEIRERLPFYLFKTQEEYYEAGGLPGSAGVFIVDSRGARLMAIAGSDSNGFTWHTVQHEGFHQFAHAVIRGELPTWVNEGIAEYFGESIFTGDAFVTGVIPPFRLKRVQSEIQTNRFKSVKDMMLMSHSQWNSELRFENYDQAWSMVHFLAQGENGRYQEAFVSFMKLIGRGTPWPNAWQQTFGSAADFEQHWKDYWLNLPKNPTNDLYAQAATEIFTSFIARARAQKQTFDSFEEFLGDAKDGKIKTGDTIDDWLPPKLLKEAADAADRAPATWKIEPLPVTKTSQLVATLEDGARMVGTYQLVRGHAVNVVVDVDDTANVIKQAQDLINTGKKEQARMLLQGALRAHPKSPSAEEARKLIAKAK
jgi:hypothetical protein